MKIITEYTDKHRIAFEEDLRIGPNEATHLVAHNIILQPFIEAQKRVGEPRCEYGNICANDSLVIFSIFKQLKDGHQGIIDEDDGSLSKEKNNTILLPMRDMVTMTKKNQMRWTILAGRKLLADL